MGGGVQSVVKVEVNDIHGSPLMHSSSSSPIAGNQVGQAQFALVQSTLTGPSCCLLFQSQAKRTHSMTFPPTKAKLIVAQTVFLAFFEDGCKTCFSSVIGDLPDHDNISEMTRVAFYNVGPFSWHP